VASILPVLVALVVTPILTSLAMMSLWLFKVSAPTLLQATTSTLKKA
jgi:hypothetical protein